MISQKTIDDFRFSNRTWAEIFQMKALDELNYLEIQFLKSINWLTHVTFSDYQKWKRNVDLLVRKKMQERAVAESAYPSPPIQMAEMSNPFSYCK